MVSSDLATRAVAVAVAVCALLTAGSAAQELGFGGFGGGLPGGLDLQAGLGMLGGLGLDEGCQASMISGGAMCLPEIMEIGNLLNSTGLTTGLATLNGTAANATDDAAMDAFLEALAEAPAPTETCCEGMRPLLEGGCMCSPTLAQMMMQFMPEQVMAAMDQLTQANCGYGLVVFPDARCPT